MKEVSIFSTKEIIISEILSVFFSSKLPVGSSAEVKSKSLITALAMATLCCSPPDKVPGLKFALSRIPKTSSKCEAFLNESFGKIFKY